MKRIEHNEAGEKWCGGCQAFRPLDDFYPHRQNWDGRAGHCKECYKRAEVKRKYQITLEEYTTIMAAGCSICGDPATHLDHDHITGRVRSALCGKCNMGLGLFNDDWELMAAAANYLREGNL